MEEGLAVGELFLDIKGHLVLNFVADADSAEHGAQDRVEELLLVYVNLGKVHGFGDLLEDFAGLSGVDAVLEVVSPALFLRDVRGNLPFVFPVDVPVRVHRGKESQALRQRTEDAVLSYHCVLAAVRDKVPVAIDILGIVEAVLPAYLDVLVRKQAVDCKDNLGLFVD